MPTSNTATTTGTPSAGSGLTDGGGELLRVALPNKGALSDEAVQMMSEAGYRCRREPSALRTIDRENGVEFIFLRPRDIATYVGDGVIDVGVSGRDLTTDSQAFVDELLQLGFGRSEFRLATPVGVPLNLLADPAPRIATSYVHVLAEHLASVGSAASIVHLDGAVELAPSLGVADAVADVVQSGRTLRVAGLEMVGEPIMRSEAVLIGRRGGVPSEAAKTLMERVRGVIVASAYVMLEYDIEERLVDEAVKVTPGLEGPTLSPLSKAGWVAIRALVRSTDLNITMDRLQAIGARGILAIDLRSCRM